MEVELTELEELLVIELEDSEDAACDDTEEPREAEVDECDVAMPKIGKVSPNSASQFIRVKVRCVICIYFQVG